MWQIIVGAFLFIGGLVNVTENFGAFIFGILTGCALIIWGLHKKGIINIRKLVTGKDAPEKSLELRAVGTGYYESSFQMLAQENPAWKKTAKEIVEFGNVNHRIYRYNYVNSPVILLHELNNPNDKNALAIHVAGNVVGYVSREENTFVLGLLKGNRIKSISCFIGGGEYKAVSTDGSTSKFETANSVSIRIQYQ